MRVIWLAVLVPFVAGAESQAGLDHRVREAVARLLDNSRRLAEFEYAFEGERKEFTSDGKLKSEQSWKGRREFREGFGVGHVHERNGKPLSSEEQQRAEEAVRKRLIALKALTPEQLRQRREEERKKRDKEDEWLKEMPDALEFQLAGEERIEGRPALVVDCEPRPGYRARNMRARLFEKVRGRFWIDQSDNEIVRAEGEAFDTVTIGWGLLGRIEKGTRFEMHRAKIAGTWLTTAQSIKFAARVMLVKNMSSEISNRWNQFRHRSEVEGPAAR